MWAPGWAGARATSLDPESSASAGSPRAGRVEDGLAVWPALSGEARALDTRLLPARGVSNPALIQKPGCEDRVASHCPQRPTWLIRT